MFHWLDSFRPGPIGLDLGARWLKMVQFSADRQRLLDAVRVDRTGPADLPWTGEQLLRSLEKALQGRTFQGNEVVVCLSDRDLILQNLRLPRTSSNELARLARQELTGRLPFKIEEAEIRCVEAGEVRSGANLQREVISFACHRSVIKQLIATLEEAGLRPLAFDVEPLALARSGHRQFSRDADRDRRLLLVHVGHRRTLAVIVEGEQPLFIKYLPVGGHEFDEAVARQFSMELPLASSLRRTFGDRRQDQQDPEVVKGIGQALRPALDRLQDELAMCIRYHNITFRGTPLAGIVLGGGEAGSVLADELQRRLELKCELSEPFRRFPVTPNVQRQGQWDVAVGLALRGLPA